MSIDNELETEKECNTCKYFRKHYVKESYSYRAIWCGDCQNLKFNYRNRKKCFPYVRVCDYWEPAVKMPPHQQKIEDVLRSMEKILVDMRAMLSEEKND